MATTLTVPDRRNAPDPNAVIDPSLVRDSTAGLQGVLNAAPAGATINLPFDLLTNGTVTVPSGKILQSVGGARRLLATTLFPWRVRPDLRKNLPGGKANPGYNPDGLCAPWLYDLTGSVKNPFGRADDKEDFGGYDGTTGASGVDYDGKHLSTRITAPFKAMHRMKGVRVLAGVLPDNWFSQIITDVAADGKTVYWKDRPGVTPYHEDSTHTVAWAIDAKLGWVVEFTPNPAWQPRYVGDKGWHNYEEALRLAVNNNRGRNVLYVSSGAAAIGLEVVGANPTWGSGVLSYDQAWPVVTEFQHGIYQAPKGVAFMCHSHHHYGDCFAGPGPIIACRGDHAGRHIAVGHFDDKEIRDSEFDMPRRATIDFETSKPVHRVKIKNLAIGGHGISMSAQMHDCVLDGIHSTDEDLESGRISQLSDFVRGASHAAPGSSNLSYLNLEFDKPQKYLITVQNVDGLHVHGVKANVTDYVVKSFYKQVAAACTNVDVSGNDGGPKADGELAPVPK